MAHLKFKKFAEGVRGIADMLRISSYREMPIRNLIFKRLIFIFRGSGVSSSLLVNLWLYLIRPCSWLALVSASLSFRFSGFHFLNCPLSVLTFISFR